MKILLTVLGFFFFINGMAQVPKYFINNYGWFDVHNGFVVLQKSNGNYLLACEVKNNTINQWNFHLLETSSIGEVLDLEGHYVEGNNTGIRDLINVSNLNIYFVTGFIREEISRVFRKVCHLSGI